MADANDFARIHYVLEHFDYIDPETRFSRGYTEFDPILNKTVHSKSV